MLCISSFHIVSITGACPATVGWPSIIATGRSTVKAEHTRPTTGATRSESLANQKEVAALHAMLTVSSAAAEY